MKPEELNDRIKEACRKQRAACNNYMKELSETHKVNYGDIILNTPLIWKETKK